MNIRKIKKFIKLIIKHCQMGIISDSAVVLSYYFLLSLIPTMVVIIAILHQVGINSENFFDSIRMIMPNKISTIILPVITSAEHFGNEKLLSINILIVIWSASRGVAAFKRILNRIYGVKGYNTIVNRIISFVLMLFAITLSIGLIFFLEFGQTLLLQVIPNDVFSFLFKSMKWFLIFMIIFILSVSLFYFVPNVKNKLKYVWLGAIISDIGVLMLARLFSFIIFYLAHRIDIYKTLGAFIILMIWLYLLSIIILFGVVFNASFQEFQAGEIKVSSSFQKIIDSEKRIKNNR